MFTTSVLTKREMSKALCIVENSDALCDQHCNKSVSQMSD